MPLIMKLRTLRTLIPCSVIIRATSGFAPQQSVTSVSSHPRFVLSSAVIDRDETMHPDPDTIDDIQSLASTTLALLSGDEEAASSLIGGAERKRHVVTSVFEKYDVCGSGGCLKVKRVSYLSTRSLLIIVLFTFRYLRHAERRRDYCAFCRPVDGPGCGVVEGWRGRRELKCDRN